jgi:glucokinase
MRYNAGADVGGTFIKCGIADENGNVLSKVEVKTPDGRDVPKAVCEAVFEAAEKAKLSIDEISTVGIGTTGVCDSEKGVVVSGANIPHYENIEMCEYVKKKTGRDAFLDNDANCAALGEYVASGSDAKSFVFITLGTGVGGGIIINGSLLRGVNGAAGEIGHISHVFEGEACSCGRKGCWERYASTRALVRALEKAGFENPDGKTAFSEAEKGNEIAKGVLSDWLNHVSGGVCDIVNIFQPEIVVIGGGVSRQGDKILNPIRKYVNEHSMTGKTKLPQTKIEAARLFNDAGIVGASFLYTQKVD